MTAEVAVLNKHAVALAADSAVTIGANSKVYNSANKLFALSKFHPVGIMIYGNAEFMGVPWETIIKSYRRTLDNLHFDRLTKYAENFFAFLSSAPFFSFEYEQTYIENKERSYYSYVREKIKEKVNKRLEINGQITDVETTVITKEVITEEFENWQKCSFLEHFPEKFADEYVRKHRKTITSLINEVFENLPLGRTEKRRLLYFAAYILCKQRFPNSKSGIVIAGFGQADVFPTALGFDVDCKVGNLIKYARNKRKSDTITEINDASVLAFAQTEMVETFMEGVDPRLQHMSSKYLELIFERYPEVIVDALGALSDSERRAVLKRLKGESQKLYEGYAQSVIDYQRNAHINPIVDMVAVLPKDELAAMAEALVNLTSFKRRVTAVAETVGGPIDVAVISKGDGFVWIKRKHYFEPELNHHFFTNYYRRICDETTES